MQLTESLGKQALVPFDYRRPTRFLSLRQHSLEMEVSTLLFKTSICHCTSLEVVSRGQEDMSDLVT